jgi:hypothetical protein
MGGWTDALRCVMLISRRRWIKFRRWDGDFVVSVEILEKMPIRSAIG